MRERFKMDRVRELERGIYIQREREKEKQRERERCEREIECEKEIEHCQVSYGIRKEWRYYVQYEHCLAIV